jgi:3',5'-cyclic AMP phosphodiesterase CpdA
MRIVLIHHPPVPGIIKWRKRLDDASALTELITRYGAELVLHGHTHAPTFTEIRTTEGNIPVIGAASASELNPHSGRCAKYNLYVMTQNGGELELKMLVRSYREESGCFEDEQETRLALPRFNPIARLSKGP